MKTENINYDLTGTFEERRFKVLRYWGNGKLTKMQIADIFDLSEAWVIKELGFIYKTLDVHSPAEMTMVCWKRKIFTDLNCDVWV